jgi:hypothetical protein
MKQVMAMLLVLAGLAFGQESGVLPLKNRIDLPNVNGRIDHFSADVKGQRIFVSALGNQHSRSARCGLRQAPPDLRGSVLSLFK